ncbi:MAG: hypothetical protein WC453_00660 [Patescibacteria group bacterium]
MGSHPYYLSRCKINTPKGYFILYCGEGKIALPGLGGAQLRIAFRPPQKNSILTKKTKAFWVFFAGGLLGLSNPELQSV